MDKVPGAENGSKELTSQHRTHKTVGRKSEYPGGSSTLIILDSADCCVRLGTGGSIHQTPLEFALRA